MHLLPFISRTLTVTQKSTYTRGSNSLLKNAVKQFLVVTGEVKTIVTPYKK
jgi:hypothetical protein